MGGGPVAAAIALTEEVAKLTIEMSALKDDQKQREKSVTQLPAIVREPSALYTRYGRSDVAPQSVIDLRSSRARSLLGGAMTFV